MDWFYPETRPSVGGVLPTAGAVPVRNEKGQVTMQKVKVTRYVAGQKPIFAEDERGYGSGDEGPFEKVKAEAKEEETVRKKDERDWDRAVANDPRWKRLQQHKTERRESSDRHSRRRVREPEVIAKGESSSDSEDSDVERPRRRHRSPEPDDQQHDVDDEEFERRRTALRQKAKQRQEEELLARQQEEAEEQEESEEEESSEYEEYTDSEDDTAPRLKPVFVRKLVFMS